MPEGLWDRWQPIPDPSGFDARCGKATGKNLFPVILMMTIPLLYPQNLNRRNVLRAASALIDATATAMFEMSFVILSV